MPRPKSVNVYTVRLLYQLENWIGAKAQKMFLSDIIELYQLENWIGAKALDSQSNSRLILYQPEK